MLPSIWERHPPNRSTIRRRFKKTPRGTLVALLLPPNRQDRLIRFISYAGIFLLLAFFLNILFYSIGIQIMREMTDFSPRLIVVHDLCSSPSIPFHFTGVIRSPSYVDLFLKNVQINIFFPSVIEDVPILKMQIPSFILYGHNFENIVDLPLQMQLDEQYHFPDIFSNDDYMKYRIALYFEVDLRSLWLPSRLPFYFQPLEEYALVTDYKKAMPFIVHQLAFVNTAEDIIHAKLLLEYAHSINYLKMSFPAVAGRFTLEPYLRSASKADTTVHKHLPIKNHTVAELHVSGFDVDPAAPSLVLVDVAISKEHIAVLNKSISEFYDVQAIRGSLHFDSAFGAQSPDSPACFLLSWLNAHGGLHFSYNFKLKEEEMGENFYWGKHRPVSRILQTEHPFRHPISTASSLGTLKSSASYRIIIPL
jgi:hypothetical protein